MGDRVPGRSAIFWPQICEATFGLDLLDASIDSLGYIIMALGLNIVVGFAGLLDLGYVAFFAIGAFVMGWLGSAHFADADIHIGASEFANRLPGIHLWFPLILISAALFTALWGAILGAPTLRLRGDYLAIVTLAFGEIVPRVFENSTSGFLGIGSTDFSNGRQGITPVDKIALAAGRRRRCATRWSSSPIYYYALAMVLLVLFVNFRLRDSRLGRAWIAVREDEVAAAAMGVNLVRTKLWAYAIGAALGGFAGVFLATYKNTVNVDQFEFGFSVFILSMVILGGYGQHLGRRPGRRRAVDDRPLPAQGAQRGARLGRAGLRRDVDQLRHLRLPAAHDDGAAARGPDPVRQTQARAARRGRRSRAIRSPRRATTSSTRSAMTEGNGRGDVARGRRTSRRSSVAWSPSTT